MNIEGQFRQAEEDNGLSWVLNANVGKLFFTLLHYTLFYIILQFIIYLITLKKPFSLTGTPGCFREYAFIKSIEAQWHEPQRSAQSESAKF